MEKEKIAETVEMCGTTSHQYADSAHIKSGADSIRRLEMATGWMQAKMLGEIAYQLAVANERNVEKQSPKPVTFAAEQVQINKPANEFEEFAKIPRLRRGCVITEKVDGTNGQIYITEEGQMFVGSRSRYVTLTDDNYGFAKWAQQHSEELLTLGPGRHYGEWWGSGIQRGYGLKNGDKRFSLFNVGRWREAEPHHEKCSRGVCPAANAARLPACVSLVPVLYDGPFSSDVVDRLIDDLRANGSRAVPGFMKPEGLIVYHAAARSLFKVTVEKDESPKGAVNT